MHTFVSRSQFLNLGPADRQFTLTIQTLGARFQVIKTRYEIMFYAAITDGSSGTTEYEPRSFDANRLIFYLLTLVKFCICT